MRFLNIDRVFEIFFSGSSYAVGSKKTATDRFWLTFLKMVVSEERLCFVFVDE